MGADGRQGYYADLPRVLWTSPLVLWSVVGAPRPPSCCRGS